MFITPIRRHAAVRDQNTCNKILNRKYNASHYKFRLISYPDLPRSGGGEISHFDIPEPTTEIGVRD